MPGDDLFLTNDGDLELTSEGQWRTTKAAQPSIRHQLMDELDAWVGDPGAGRRIKGINGRNNTEAEADEEAASVIDSLGLLEEEGLVADVTVETDRDPKGRIGLNIRSRDTQSGGSTTVSSLKGFGIQ